MEVWSGMILGFDNDDHDIFERQIAFIRDARIVNSMVGMLSAIPKTPLYDRLIREGRLDPDDRQPFGTNVIPNGMDRTQLREGYLRVMRELYAPEAYFGRLDDLYLKGGLRQSNPRRRHLQDKPWRRFLLNASLLAEALFIFLRLQTKVKDSDLRRHYRRSMGRLLRRRLPVDIWQVYAIKAAMHYHVHTLVNAMNGDEPLVNTF
jgi:ribosomal protein L39E